MQVSRNHKDYFMLILKGLAMGTANKVPGVSGGVVALVGGFYQEFIYSLQRINGFALKLLLKGKFSAVFKHINGAFLIAIITGMIISFFSVSKLLDYLINQYQLYVWSAFFGMILGSIYAITKRFKNWKKQAIVFILIGTAIGMYISFMRPSVENDHLFFVFFCGIISVSGMTLPGLSGSFILIIIGNYVLLLVDSVNALYDTFTDIITGNFNFIHHPKRIRLLKVLAFFTTGSVVGMVSFSHVINYLLQHYKLATIGTITGFIIGSLGIVWPWKITLYKTATNGSFITNNNQNKIITAYQRYIPELTTETLIAIGYIVLGLSIILVLERQGNRAKKTTLKV